MMNCILCMPQSHPDVPRKEVHGIIHRENCKLFTADLKEHQIEMMHDLMRLVIDERREV